MSLKPSEANRLRGLIGRRVSAARQLAWLEDVGSAFGETFEAADREDSRTAKELADYINKLEEQ